MVDLAAYAGGIALTAYVAMFVLSFLYQKAERKIYLVKNIFYFATKLEAKTNT